MLEYKFENPVSALEKINSTKEVPGFMESYNQKLYLYFQGLFSTKAAEIGTYCGLSAVIVGLGMRGHGKYYCVDTFKCSNEELEKKDCYSIWQNNIKRYCLEETCIPVIGWSFSPSVYHRIPYNLDFVYIDGDHHTECVILDGILYRQKLRENGLMVFHDATWDSVAKGIRQLIKFGLLEIIHAEDDYLVARRTQNPGLPSNDYLLNLRKEVERIMKV